MFTLQKMNLLKFALMSTMFLSGCSANHYSIHWADQLNPDESAVISVDAKQRFLLSNVITKPEKATHVTKGNQGTQAKLMTPEKFRRFCAEPSPDVFSVLSQAASGSGSFGQTADPKSINIALQAAFSSSETGSTISRTQTINMLKEMMYRTCERYLNGQIDDLEYPIIAARDQRIMTSILAIEQLTGTVLPKPVIIAATGSASGGKSTNDAILSLDNAKKKVDEKNNALETAQKEFVEIDKPEGSCETLMAKNAGEVTTDEDKTKLEKCKEKKGNVEKAEKELKDAKAYYEAIINLAGNSGVSSAITSAILSTSSPTTEIDKQIEQARSQTIQKVAKVVDKIVSRSFRQEDETSFFCYRALDKNIKEVSESCVEFITAKVKNESARIENESARLQLETEETKKQMDELRKSSFEKFWDKIKNGANQVDKAKLKERIDRKFPKRAARPIQDKLDEMKKKNTKDEILKIFNTLPLWVIDKLIED